ncbi:unnamed protein product [Trichobilharzia szidati]|nr:unnamed protein product [Trichobilharzia szidati]
MSNLQFACNVCNVRCDTENVLRLHEQGKKHRLKCLSLQKSNSVSHIHQPLKVSLPVLTTPESSPKDLSWDMCKPSSRALKNSTPDHESPVNMVSIDSNSKYFNADMKQKFLLPDGSLFCSSCDVKMNSWEQLAAHIGGRKHQSKSNVNTIDSKNLETTNTLLDGDDSKSIFYRCEDCEAIVFRSAMQEHLNSEEHKLGTAKIHGSSVIGFDYILPLREYRRSCQEVLCPVWPSVKFTDAEANLLLEAAKNDDDCILLLSSCDGRSRVGLHLANALLIANRNFPPSNNFGSSLKPSTSTTPTDITCVLWIAPETPMTTATNRSHSTFTFQPGGEKSSTGRPLIFAYPPFDPSVLSETDIVRTNSGGFITHLAWLLMQQKFLCGIIIEDVKIVSKDVEFCQLLTCFLKVYSRQVNRGRIICFNESKVEPGSIFSSFAQYE